jgi:hypothetical protein
LKKLDQAIKTGTIEEARVLAKPEAARLRELSEVFDINPKIDKSQRRIQCSIPFKVFYQTVLGQAGEPRPQEKLELFGWPFPAELPLGIRSRK